MIEDEPQRNDRQLGRHNLLETDDGLFVSRIVKPNRLGEYEDHGSFGMNALEHLGIDTSQPESEQLQALADVTERELTLVASEHLAIVPFERDQDDDGTLTYFAQLVHPAEGNQDPTKRLQYVPRVFDYLESKFDSFTRLEATEITQPEAFHADLALPGQYVFGVTGDDPSEKLYMVDLDPVAAPVATMVDGKWQLSYVLTTQVRDLAVVAHQLPNGLEMAEAFRGLAEKIEATGVAHEGYADFVVAILERGYTYEGESELYEM